MVKAVFPLYFISKRCGIAFNLRLAQSALSNKRCFSSQDDGDQKPKVAQDDGDQKSKEPQHHKAREDAKPKKNIETLSSEERKSAAKKKLFSLLSELEVASNDQKPSGSKLNLAKAVKRQLKGERLQELIAEREKSSPEGKLETAAKAVAQSVKGDPSKTLSELNEKLRLLNLAKAPPKEPEEVKDDIVVDEESSKSIMSSVEQVASVVSDAATPIKSQLAQRLLRLSRETKSEDSKISIDNLVKSMKVEEKPRPQVEVKEQRDRSRFQPQGPPRQRLGIQAKINIFEAAPLEIFPIDGQANVGEKQSVWQSLEEKELKLLTQYAPANAFEEMIMWTEQGKHWKFPIDNDTEMCEEENVGFHEHVFLDKHLQDFPTKGPIRHFMELVIVGLSKNPYITVERKIENIDWFRDYFSEKESLLRDSGAIG